MNAQRLVGFYEKGYIRKWHAAYSFCLPRRNGRERLNDKRSQKRQVRGTLLTERDLARLQQLGGET
jgi:hypothetical protein